MARRRRPGPRRPDPNDPRYRTNQGGRIAPRGETDLTVSQRAALRAQEAGTVAASVETGAKARAAADAQARREAAVRSAGEARTAAGTRAAGAATAAAQRGRETQALRGGAIADQKQMSSAQLAETLGLQDEATRGIYEQNLKFRKEQADLTRQATQDEMIANKQILEGNAKRAALTDIGAKLVGFGAGIGKQMLEARLRVQQLKRQKLLLEQDRIHKQLDITMRDMTSDEREAYMKTDEYRNRYADIIRGLEALDPEIAEEALTTVEHAGKLREFTDLSGMLDSADQELKTIYEKLSYESAAKAGDNPDNAHVYEQEAIKHSDGLGGTEIEKEKRRLKIKQDARQAQVRGYLSQAQHGTKIDLNKLSKAESVLEDPNNDDKLSPLFRKQSRELIRKLKKQAAKEAAKKGDGRKFTAVNNFYKFAVGEGKAGVFLTPPGELKRQGFSPKQADVIATNNYNIMKRLSEKDPEKPISAADIDVMSKKYPGTADEQDKYRNQLEKSIAFYKNRFGSHEADVLDEIKQGPNKSVIDWTPEERRRAGSLPTSVARDISTEFVGALKQGSKGITELMAKHGDGRIIKALRQMATSDKSEHAELKDRASLALLNYDEKAKAILGNSGIGLILRGADQPLPDWRKTRGKTAPFAFSKKIDDIEAQMGEVEADSFKNALVRGAVIAVENKNPETRGRPIHDKEKRALIQEQLDMFGDKAEELVSAQEAAREGRSMWGTFGLVQTDRLLPSERTIYRNGRNFILSPSEQRHYGISEEDYRAGSNESLLSLENAPRFLNSERANLDLDSETMRLLAHPEAKVYLEKTEGQKGTPHNTLVVEVLGIGFLGAQTARPIMNAGGEAVTVLDADVAQGRIFAFGKRIPPIRYKKPELPKLDEQTRKRYELGLK